MPDNTSLIDIQVAPSALQPENTETATDLVIPPLRVADRLRHFPEEVYDVSAESHISKFMKVLLGDAGAGRIKKQLFMQRLRSTLQGTHFFDLDRFYGPLFGIRRVPSEILQFDPYRGTATREQWDDVYARDASFRSRIEQLARAIPYGPTPTGMELIAEAVLACDCEILEEYHRADAGFQTYQELEDAYGVNLLTDNQSSIEADASEWVIGANIDAITQTTDWFFPDGFTVGGGANALEVETDGVGDAVFDGDFAVTTVPGESYAFAVVAAAAAGNVGPVNAYISVEWQESDTTPISTDDGTATPIGPFGDDEDVTLGAALNVVATAPPLAELAVIHVTIVSPADDDLYYFDRFEASSLNLADMEDELYIDLEGFGLPDLYGNDRRLFTVRAKRSISVEDAYHLGRVLDRLKPADARYHIAQRDIGLYEDVPIHQALADSIYWEVISKISVLNPLVPEAQLPYTSLGEAPTEQPRPPFSGYQGEAWSYVVNIDGVSAYSEFEGSIRLLGTQFTVYTNDEYTEFPPANAVFPIRLVQAGRSVSDAVMLSYPYPITKYAVGADGPGDFLQLKNQSLVENRTTAPFLSTYVDGIPLDALNQTLKVLGSLDPFQQNPEHRYWVTERRFMEDKTEEVIEFRLKPSLVNYITFEVPRYPHIATVEVSKNGTWTQVDIEHVVNTSVPAFWSTSDKSLVRQGHPDHNFAGHWTRVAGKIDPDVIDGVRVRLTRTGCDLEVGHTGLHSSSTGAVGVPPRRKGRPSVLNGPVDNIDQAYSLGVRSFDVGYRVFSRADFEFFDSEVLAETRDAIGATVQFEVQEQDPSRAIDESSVTAWRSEPQPVNYAVVNFYLDTEEEQTIDRFYMDPTHQGANFNIYYSKSLAESDGTEGFYEDLVWIPIPRSYVLQKGFVRLPQTKARYWKFEFTNLVPELYESFVPLNRRTKFFPPEVVKPALLGIADEALTPGMRRQIEESSDSRYTDALEALRVQSEGGSEPGLYGPTESIYSRDPSGQQTLREQSWTFGFLPWHQDDGYYPKFDRAGQHVYDEIEVLHNYKIAFFVGLREIRAYRVKTESEENTEIYWDTYDDNRNLGTSTWTQQDGYLYSTVSPSSVESRVFGSRSPVKAIQFASIQSEPIQIVPDHLFRDVTFWPDYTWDDPDSWLRIGEAQMIYSANDYSVIVVRHDTVPAGAFGDDQESIIDPMINPVFATLPWDAELILNSTEGGAATPVIQLVSGRTAYAAARFTMITDQTSPLYLQVWDNINGVVLVEREMVGRRGETVEAYLGFNASVSEARVRLIQKGKSNDIWRMEALSGFEDSIQWEFSVNGGEDWLPASEVRNNQNGILTFPTPGNQLRYRVSTNRTGQWVSAIKIRPHYLGVKNARASSNNRGPNLSVWDEDIPINVDPLFTQWNKPIPYWWFASSRRFPLLAVEGLADPQPVAKFFGRPISTDLSSITDGAEVVIIQGRVINEVLNTPGTGATRELTLLRDAGSDISGMTDEADLDQIEGVSDPIVSDIVDDI